MGVVYRAEHPRLGARIALKVMDPELAMDEVFRERFVREARAAARITHPNIVPIYDAGEWAGDLYIAMRYIEGEDLRTVLRKNHSLPIHETYVIGLQIAGALDAAHRAGLIHRDVKPANILVEPSSDEAEIIAYLADLGLTKHIDSHTGVTESGALLGTIDYIAPEQISGAQVDGRADIYSLACVLFECLTGSVPYERENQAAVLWAHLHDDVPRASALNPSLTEEVDAALARGMAKSPEERFSTDRELVEALEAPLEAATVVARKRTETRPMPRTSEPTRGRRGNRRSVAVAAAVGLVLGGAGAAAATFLVASDETAAPRTAPVGPPTDATTQVPTERRLTPFDAQLMRYVPDQLRAGCRHATPPTGEFDAALSCNPGGVVSSLMYSHARSGFHLYDYFALRLHRAGLPASQPLTLTGLCSTGDIPSVNTAVSAGLSRRAAVVERVPRESRLGFVLCYRHGGLARIEWITNEIGVYAAATGETFAPLYQWWRRDAGPEA
jgi:hypothetical protein